eukprot:SAG11_NODE_588_length_8329_cov_18.642857_10_plen_54_part_00
MAQLLTLLPWRIGSALCGTISERGRSRAHAVGGAAGGPRPAPRREATEAASCA